MPHQRLLPIVAAALLAPLTTAAGQAVPAERATLLQLGITGPDTVPADRRRAALAAEAGRITRCEQAFDAVDRLKSAGLTGNLTIRNNVPLSALPAPLRTAIQARPVGRATPIYGGDADMRVLVRCAPGFRVPTPRSITPVPRPSSSPRTI